MTAVPREVAVWRPADVTPIPRQMPPTMLRFLEAHPPAPARRSVWTWLVAPFRGEPSLEFVLVLFVAVLGLSGLTGVLLSQIF